MTSCHSASDEVFGLLADIDAGVVEKDVDTAEVPGDFGDRPVDIVGLARHLP